MTSQGRLFDVEPSAERCCKTCIHGERRHGRIKRGMHPLVCMLFAKPVPYVCGDGQNGISPDYPCRVSVDASGPYPRGWEAR